jgi:hypothetical protein
MSAERGWIGDPQPTAERRKHSVEMWAERHRLEGHHPHPAPSDENPERWECKCDPDAAWTSVWRILTAEQTREKFAKMFGDRARAREAGIPLPEDDPAWQERIRQAKRRTQ